MVSACAAAYCASSATSTTSASAARRVERAASGPAWPTAAAPRHPVTPSRRPPTTIPDTPFYTPDDDVPEDFSDHGSHHGETAPQPDDALCTLGRAELQLAVAKVKLQAARSRRASEAKQVLDFDVL